MPRQGQRCLVTSGPIEVLRPGSPDRAHDAPAKGLRWDDHDKLRNRLATFIGTCRVGRRQNTLNRLAPDAFICKQATIEPEEFTLNPFTECRE
jgi:hypothetical protein